VDLKVIAGNGHTGLPDRDKIQQMRFATRNPVPRELTWQLTDKVIQDFYWLNVPVPAKRQLIEASCQANRLVVKTTNIVVAAVWLDSRLIDFSKPVTLDLNGETSTHKVRPSLRVLCESLQRRGDPELAFTARLDLPIQPRPSGQPSR